MIDEAKFFAWLDGELDAAEASKVEVEVAGDPELQRLADEHRAMSAGLRGAFGHVADAPVPQRLRNTTKAETDVVDLAARRAARRPFGSLPQWAAMAASLVIGIAIGAISLNGSSQQPVETRGGQIYAAGAVDRALDTQLASASPGGDVRIGLTFRNSEGAICRSFEADAATGLACRDEGDWRLRGLFPAPDRQQTEYRMAASPNQQLLDLVDSTIAGDPFDAAAEAQAKERGWR